MNRMFFKQNNPTFEEMIEVIMKYNSNLSKQLQKNELRNCPS